MRKKEKKRKVYAVRRHSGSGSGDNRLQPTLLLLERCWKSLTTGCRTSSYFASVAAMVGRINRAVDSVVVVKFPCLMPVHLLLHQARHGDAVSTCCNCVDVSLASRGQVQVVFVHRQGDNHSIPDRYHSISDTSVSKSIKTLGRGHVPLQHVQLGGGHGDIKMHIVAAAGMTRVTAQHAECHFHLNEQLPHINPDLPHYS